jgi:hypothetical protein
MTQVAWNSQPDERLMAIINKNNFFGCKFSHLLLHEILVHWRVTVWFGRLFGHVNVIPYTL